MSLLLSVAKSILYVYFGLYALIHALIYVYPEQTGQYLVFQNIVHWPFNNLKNPTELQLNNVHNLYVDVERDVTVGIWHFIPEHLGYEYAKQRDSSNDDHLNRYLAKNPQIPIMIYVHGNDRDRASSFRVEKCKRLLELGYHVFAIDYRGYGDSTGIPSETGIVKDVLTLYDLLMSYNRDATIYFYGHSLGTGISTHAAMILSDRQMKLNGLILEAPFINISQASKDYHASLLFMNNKWIQTRIDEIFDKLNIRFNNDKNIVKVNTKIMIMHAEDDWFIPQQHSIHLYKVCQTQRPKNFPPVKLVELEKKHGLGHFLHTHLPIYKLIKDFLES